MWFADSLSLKGRKKKSEALNPARAHTRTGETFPGRWRVKRGRRSRKEGHVRRRSLSVYLLIHFLFSPPPSQLTGCPQPPSCSGINFTSCSAHVGTKFFDLPNFYNSAGLVMYTYKNIIEALYLLNGNCFFPFAVQQNILPSFSRVKLL